MAVCKGSDIAPHQSKAPPRRERAARARAFSRCSLEASAPRDFALYTARRREAGRPAGCAAGCLLLWQVVPPTPEHSGHLDRTLGTDQAGLPGRQAVSPGLRGARAARRGCATRGRRERPRREPKPKGRPSFWVLRWSECCSSLHRVGVCWRDCWGIGALGFKICSTR